MNLLAISDLHLGYKENREFLLELEARPQDYLAIVGDIGETNWQLKFALETLVPCFKQIIWVPGNHDLWCTKEDGQMLAGQEKYLNLVNLCRQYGVLTPEDPFLQVDFDGQQVYLCPLFTLFDYSFRPEGIPIEGAVDWAKESGVVSSDEYCLQPTPYNSLSDWCAHRCHLSYQKLLALNGQPTILINHYPLRGDLVFLPTIPRFRIWCGTQRTENWHRQFNAQLVLYGHLHTPKQTMHEGVRFEEVSLGYPKQWRHWRTADDFLRPLFPL